MRFPIYTQGRWKPPNLYGQKIMKFMYLYKVNSLTLNKWKIVLLYDIDSLEPDWEIKGHYNNFFLSAFMYTYRYLF